ncbi:hypothetical protein DYE49_09235 [Treponema rectale]|jgi:hypothetical protein|uniref:Lipoprotein n=1 Tax=Treponema rectale TaxID=744512 RepID=A0A840SH82_9SPIR|nr:hypothetical protein [Treponema rectale]MBB5220055.1 hypothetical protein [Treponema rectale]QOS40632.1 hypothetical protein DYE49_09235 [Treponema rectale]
MKKTNLFLAAVILSAGSYLSSCASTNEASTPSITTGSSVTRETIDWKGAVVNREPPVWVYDALASDYESLENGELAGKIKDKYYVVVSGSRVKKTDRDLKLLESSVSANYMVQIAQTLNNGVDQRFSGSLSTNEDTQKQLTATATEAKFTGFMKVGDYWLLQRVTDKKTDKTTENYTVVQVYACEKDLWQQQAAAYIQQLGLNTDSADLKKAGQMADEIAASLKPATSAAVYGDTDGVYFTAE